MSSPYGRYVINYFSSLPDFFQRQNDILFQDWTRPNGCRMLRIAERLDSRHMKVVKVASLTQKAAFTLQDTPLVLILTYLLHGAESFLKS